MSSTNRTEKTCFRFQNGVEFNRHFHISFGNDFFVKIVLNGHIREKGEFIPPLVNIYMNLSPTMKTFGTAVNPDFGNVEETGILVTIADIFPDKKERHVDF